MEDMNGVMGVDILPLWVWMELPYNPPNLQYTSSTSKDVDPGQVSVSLLLECPSCRRVGYPVEQDTIRSEGGERGSVP